MEAPSSNPLSVKRCFDKCFVVSVVNKIDVDRHTTRVANKQRVTGHSVSVANKFDVDRHTAHVVNKQRNTRHNGGLNSQCEWDQPGLFRVDALVK